MENFLFFLRQIQTMLSHLLQWEMLCTMTDQPLWIMLIVWISVGNVCVCIDTASSGGFLRVGVALTLNFSSNRAIQLHEREPET
jgi:hypothetical protein